MNSSSPLEGLRVLDLSRVLSGPFASMTLADRPKGRIVKVNRLLQLKLQCSMDIRNVFMQN